MHHASLLTATSALALAVAATLTLATPALADDDSAWRLFVADHESPTVTVLDAADGKNLANVTLKSPAALHATESGETVFAVQRDGDEVAAISTGIALDDHGDHGDLRLSQPVLLDGRVTGERPIHFVDHGGSIALFFDGEGVARIVDEGDMRNGDVTFREIAASAPHHGVAAVLGKHTLMSVPNPEDAGEPPIGLAVLDAANEPVGAVHDCPGLHGEAASGRLMAIGCQTGLLIVRPGAAPAIDHLAYPADFPEGKTGTLLGGKSLQYFLGNYGASAVVLVDPDAEDAFRLIELPVRRVHFAIDPVRAKFAYVFTEDGRLHRLDVLSGELTDAIPLTEPYSMDGHWSAPRPRIAVTDRAIIVTDPLAGVLQIVDAETFEKTGEIDIEGRPFNIVAVGASGAAH